MQNTSSPNTRIAKNSLYLSVRMVIVMCISLYTSRVVLRTLGVEDYGIYNVVCGFVSMFTFLNTSMSNGIQRFYSYELGKNGLEGANRVYITSLIIQLLLATLIIVLTESFGLWYLHNKMVIPENRLYAAGWIFQFSIIEFFFIIMRVPYTAAVMAHERMDFFAIVSIFDAVLKLVLVVILPSVPYDKLIIYGSFSLLLHLIGFLFYFIYCKKQFVEIKIPKRKDKSIDKSLLGPMLSFSGWNLFGSFSNMMRDQGINLIMNLFYGPIVNAARGVAMQVNSAIHNLVGSILTPVRPQVIQSYAKGEIERSMRLTFSISKFSLCFLMLLALPISVEIDYILYLWLGASVPEHSATFCIIILATTAILIPMGALATLVHASGKMKKYQIIGSTVKILSVPIAYFMMFLGFAPEWALVSVLFFDALGLLAGMLVIKTLMPFSIRLYIKCVVLPVSLVFAVSLLVDSSIHFSIENQLLRLLMVLSIGTIVSLLSFYCIAITKDEKLLLNGLIGTWFKSKSKS